MSEPEPRTWRPRWLLAAPFLGSAPALTRRQWRVFGLLSAAAFFGQYDRALMGLALPQIQHGLGIGEGEVGLLASFVRLGALPAFALALAADRAGRRRVLLWATLAGTLLTGATALAPGATSFAALQFGASVFTTALALLAVVVLAEELDAPMRGWGVGAFFALQACGVGLAALLLPLVELTPGGWRGLFVVGLAPLLFLPGWRRALPETARFEAQRAASPAAQPFVAAQSLAPMLALVRAYPVRFAALSAVVFTFSAAAAAADFFSVKYLQQAHGWAPGQVALLYLLGGSLAIAGSAQAGRLSDRIGRRPAATAFATGVVVLALGFYNGPGAWLPPLWIALIVFLLATEVMLATYGSELFPTSQRATAAGARMLVTTLGSVLGLALESLLYAWLGSHWQAISLLLLFGLLAPLVVAATFPETAGRSLEEIAPEPIARPVSLSLSNARPEETA